MSTANEESKEANETKNESGSQPNPSDALSEVPHVQSSPEKKTGNSSKTQKQLNQNSESKTDSVYYLFTDMSGHTEFVNIEQKK